MTRLPGVAQVKKEITAQENTEPQAHCAATVRGEEEVMPAGLGICSVFEG